ncbi:MAG: IMP dehydrogenase [Sulfolobales archaeon]
MKSFRDKIYSSPYVSDLEELYLIPSSSDVDPRDVDTSTNFSRNIRLRIPIASAPMDTVSEWKLAVSVALMGGIGVIHRNMSVEEQIANLEKVKKHPAIALEPLYLTFFEPCGRAIDLMRRKGIRVIPIINDRGLFMGYVRYSDLLESCREWVEPLAKHIYQGKAYNLSSLEEARKSIIRGETDLVAIINDDGTIIGSITIDTAIEDISPATDPYGRLLVAAAVNPIDMNRAVKLDKFSDALVSDVAHFNNKEVLRASATLVKNISSDFIAGNIGTAEAALEAISTIDRIDGMRVGIGGGSICTTPNVAGVFSPTGWAVASVRDALEENNLRIPIIADGGLRSSSDIVKVLALGASSAMTGYLLAGTDEAPPDLIEIGGRLYKPYRGMASYTAMMRRHSIDRYARVIKNIPEGVGGLIPYRGSARSVLREIIEGIRISMGYVGARNIEDLWVKARFIRAPRKKVLGDEV